MWVVVSVSVGLPFVHVLASVRWLVSLQYAISHAHVMDVWKPQRNRLSTSQDLIWPICN